METSDSPWLNPMDSMATSPSLRWHRASRKRPFEVKAEPKPRCSAIMAALKELNSIPRDIETFKKRAWGCTPDIWICWICRMDVKNRQVVNG